MRGGADIAGVGDMDTPDDFEEYRGPYYRAAYERARKHIDTKTPIPSLERLLLRILWLHDTKQVEYPDTDVARVIQAHIVKLLHEGRGMIGCAYQGAMLGVVHHARGMLEVLATVIYVFADPSKTAARVEAYCEYEFVRRYFEWHEWKGRLAQGQCTQQEFQKGCFVRESDGSPSPVRMARWRTLFGDKKGKLKRAPIGWHRGSYTAILRSHDPTLAKAYGQLSSGGTHLSALATNLLGGMVALRSDPAQLTRECMASLHFINETLNLLPQPGPAIREGCSKEIEGLAAVCMSLGPLRS